MTPYQRAVRGYTRFMLHHVTPTFHAVAVTVLVLDLALITVTGLLMAARLLPMPGAV